VRRFEGVKLLTGKGRYQDDANLAGQLYAVFLRSPHSHAVIRSIDTEAAAAAPGVIAVYTGADYASV
jgi:carbon-monoxide dehydrogenase large subunit